MALQRRILIGLYRDLIYLSNPVLTLAGQRNALVDKVINCRFALIGIES
jgi:hypothetical protein